ncbi:transposable element Tc3 transposase [Trichonephila clavipes]|nr:transposable element Tc3 transposase [Trichonephila clavipes]
MRPKAYCAHPSIRDHWELRCMNRFPDRVVSLMRKPPVLSFQASFFGTSFIDPLQTQEHQSISNCYFSTAIAICYKLLLLLQITVCYTVAFKLEVSEELGIAQRVFSKFWQRFQDDGNRALGTRYHQENTIERHRYGGAGWLVWGGIILGSRTDLHVQSVTMTGHIYRDVILEQHVRLFRGAMGAEFLFMDDNARPHRANIVDECLQSEDITRMDWPAYSPNLNPIEHVWDMLGRRISARQPPPTCLPELRRALLDEWFNIPQDQIDNLILSMPRRCKACIVSSRRFVEWAQNEIAVVPDFHKRILFSDEAHFWLNGYVNKQNYSIWSEANLQVYVETPLHPEKLTVWCVLWAGGILLQKR